MFQAEQPVETNQITGLAWLENAGLRDKLNAS
jgi:hypothetical protein